MESVTENGKFTQETSDFIKKYGCLSWDEILKSLAYPHNPDDLKAVKIKGDSMIDEHIKTGDIAIFHPKKIEGNGIYVVSVDKKLFVKRVEFDPSNQQITITSANPDCQPRIFSGAELVNLKIEGRVVATYHEV